MGFGQQYIPQSQLETIKEYYPDGKTLKSEITLNDGRKHGLCKFYYQIWIIFAKKGFLRTDI